MSVFSIIQLLLRAIGCIETADKILEAYEAKKRAQNVADAPKTKSELVDDLNNGRL